MSGLSAQEKSALRIEAWAPAALDSTSDLTRLYVPNTLELNKDRTGRVSPACLVSNCWFKSGSRSEIPASMRGGFVGRYRDTCVWVPCCGRDQLAKLTLTVLDIAFNDPATNPTTEVFAFIGSDGSQVTGLSNASYVARATIARGASVSSVLPSSSVTATPPVGDELKLLQERKREARLNFKRSLSTENGVNIFDLVRRIPSTVTKIEYTSNNYVRRELSNSGSDELMRAAAYFLAKGRDALPSGNQKMDSEMLEEIAVSAREFLNAEFQLQSLSGTASTPSKGASADGPKPSLRSRSSDALRINQELSVLGLGL